MKIRILKDFIGRVDSKSIGFKEGMVVDVPDEDGDHMVRGHYAELVKPAVKVLEKPAQAKAVKAK